jgi:hypothetical protein
VPVVLFEPGENGLRRVGGDEYLDAALGHPLPGVGAERICLLAVVRTGATTLGGGARVAPAHREPHSPEDLVARGRLLPSVSGDGGDAWWVGPFDPEDHRRLASMMAG